MAKEKKEIKLNRDFDNSFDEMLLDQSAVQNKKDGITNIPISQLKAFVNHPFMVLDDEKMDELVESVATQGIMSPVVVRPKNGYYELISGHRRTHAAMRAGLTEVPAVIREMDDEEATVMMVDANIQREFLLPSERAHSLRMKMDAMARIRARGENLGNRARDLIGEQSGMSGRTVQRYLSLNQLLPELMQMVDDKKIVMNVALELTGFDGEVQGWILEYLQMGGTLNVEMLRKIKDASETREVTMNLVDEILNEHAHKPKSRKLVISEKKLLKYFEPYYTIDDIEEVVYLLLDQWKRNQGVSESE